MKRERPTVLYFSSVLITRIFLDVSLFLQLAHGGMQDALECIFVVWVYMCICQLGGYLKGKCHSVSDLMYSVTFQWSEKSAVSAKTSTRLKHLMHRRLSCYHVFLCPNQTRPFMTQCNKGNPVFYHLCLFTVSFLQTS